MRYLINAKATFDASHQLADSVVCDKPHGHRWEVEVEAGGEMGPRKRPYEERLLLLTDLRELTTEYNLRDLNVMLPAAKPTPENVAIQIMERLRFKWPRITRVTVAHDEVSSVSIINEESP